MLNYTEYSAEQKFSNTKHGWGSPEEKNRKCYKGWFRFKRKCRRFRYLCLVTLIFFINELIISDPARAQMAMSSMMPPYMDSVGQTGGGLLTSTSFYQPPVLQAIRVHQDNPFEFDFIVDPSSKDSIRKQESSRLIRYFLTAVTIPEEKMWVNLSPYESDRIVPNTLARTEFGRDLLLQDYQLKQFAASLTFPEKELGKEFWERCYAKALEMYGTTQLPINTFNKVWIVPKRAVVYESDDTAFISESALSVLLEDDYLAYQKEGVIPKNKDIKSSESEQLSYISKEIMRKIILPEIEKEVNEGKHFAALRQIFHSLILAEWFKRRLRKSWVYRAYIDNNKIKGVDTVDKGIKNDIYDAYLKMFKRGVYNYIREDSDPNTQEMVPRKYFSGGFSFANSWKWLSIRPLNSDGREEISRLTQKVQKGVFVKIFLYPSNFKAFMPSGNFFQNLKDKGYKWKKRLATLALVFMLFSPFSGANAENIASDSYVAAPPVAEQNIYKTGKSINPEVLLLLKEALSIKDVLSLDGKVNPVTGKTYKIDAQYFQKNWDHIFESRKYDWPQETIVVALQNKFYLSEDGDLGPETRDTISNFFKAKIKEASLSQNKVKEGDRGKDGATQSAQESPPANDKKEYNKENTRGDVIGGENVPTGNDKTLSEIFIAGNKKENSVFDRFMSFYTDTNTLLMFLLSPIAIIMSIVQNLRARSKNPFDQESFLKLMTEYLNGSRANSLAERLESSLIRKGARLKEVFVRRRGNKLEIILQTDHALIDNTWEIRKKISNAIRRVFETQHVKVWLNEGPPVFLKFKTSQVRTSKIKLIFNLPKSSRASIHGGDPVFISYRTDNASDDFRTFQIPLVNDTAEEFLRKWKGSINFQRLFINPIDLQKQQSVVKNRLVKSRSLYNQVQKRFKSFDEKNRRKYKSSYQKVLSSGKNDSGSKGSRDDYFDAVKNAKKVFLSERRIVSLKRKLNKNIQDSEEINALLSLQDLVKEISTIRHRNKFIFKKFRYAPAKINFNMRRRAFETLKKLVLKFDEDDNEMEGYKEYFYHLTRYYNISRKIMGHAGSLDSLKSNFLAFRDPLHFNVFGIPFDKWIRIVFLQEYHYQNIKNQIVEEDMDDLYQEMRALDRLERRILQSEYVEGPAYSMESLREEFDVFNLPLETPYAESLIGEDNLRRHGKIVRRVRTFIAIMVGFGFIFFLGSTVQFWISLIVLGISFALVNFFIPRHIISFTKKAYENYDGQIRKLFKVTRASDPVFDSSDSSKGVLLEKFTRNYLSPTKEYFSKFILYSSRFSTVKAVKTDGHIEVRLITDSYFQEDPQIIKKIRKDLYAGYLKFYVFSGENPVEVPPEEVGIVLHPTGPRIRIDSKGESWTSIGIMYDDVMENDGITKILIKTTPFQELVNLWDETKVKGYKTQDLRGLIKKVDDFINEEGLAFSDFRKHAGHFHVISDRAFDMYVELSSREDLSEYAAYFLNLAKLADEIRILMAGFTGNDIRKGEYLPDKHWLLKKIGKTPIATLLRSLFGVTYLYETSTANILTSINKVAVLSEHLEKKLVKLSRKDRPLRRQARLMAKKLKSEFKKIDLSFRYVSEHGLTHGLDREGRGLRAWIKLFYAVLFLTSVMVFFSIGFIFVLNWIGIPVSLSGFFMFFKISQMTGASLSIVSMAIFITSAWIIPHLAHIETRREHRFYKEIIEEFAKNPDKSREEKQALNAKRKKFAQKGNKHFNESLLIASVAFPPLVPALSILQHTKKISAKRFLPRVSSPILIEEKTIPEKNLGGIDLKMESNNKLDVRESPSMNSINVNSKLMPLNFQGFEFQILQLQPFLNLGSFFGEGVVSLSDSVTPS